MQVLMTLSQAYLEHSRNVEALLEELVYQHAGNWVEREAYFQRLYARYGHRTHDHDDLHDAIQ